MEFSVLPTWIACGSDDTHAYIQGLIQLVAFTGTTCCEVTSLNKSFGRMQEVVIAFHTDHVGERRISFFCFDGPIFSEAVKFWYRGETVLREGFWFRDLLPQP